MNNRIENSGKLRTYNRAWRHKFRALMDVGLQKMTKAEFAVYATLLRDTRPDGTARTAVSDLATRTAMAHRTVRRAIRSLIQHGDLRVIKGGVPGQATLYTLFSPKILATLNPTTEQWAMIDDYGDLRAPLTGTREH